jgi:ribosome-binding factor A
VFQEDRSIERGTRVLSLINQLSRDRPMDAVEGDRKPEAEKGADEFDDTDIWAEE